MVSVKVSDQALVTYGSVLVKGGKKWSWYLKKKTVGSRYLWRLRYDDAKKLRKGQEISAVHIFFWSNSPQIIQIRHLYKFCARNGAINCTETVQSVEIQKCTPVASDVYTAGVNPKHKYLIYPIGATSSGKTLR